MGEWLRLLPASFPSKPEKGMTMYELAFYAFISSLIVSVVSLIGIASFSWSGARMQKATNLLVSMAAGAMLGNALLHLLPHSLEYASLTSQTQIVHQHNDAPAGKLGPSGTPTVSQEHDHDHDHDSVVPAPGTTGDHDKGHDHDHDHDHDAVATAPGDGHNHAPASAEHQHSHGHPGLGVAALILAGLLGMLAFDFVLLSYGRSSDAAVKPVGYMVLLGDGLENFIDGMVIGTAYLVSVPLGVATTIAVFAHEIPIEMGDFAVLVRSGFSRKKALLLNFLSGLVSVAGVGVAVFAGTLVPAFASYATPIAAGAFLYLAGTALLPQIRESGTGKGKLVSFAMILLGVAIMAAILLIE